MEKDKHNWTLSELAQILGAELVGDGTIGVKGPIQAGEDDPAGVAFAESDSFLDLAEGTDCAAVIVGKDCRASAKPLLKVDNPRVAFFQLLHLSQRPLPINSGMHPSAVVSPDATVDPAASVGPFVVIEAGVTVAAGARIFPHSYIGENCSIGEGATVYPNVVLYRDVAVGKNAVLHSGCVIGADGFGFVWDGKRRLKIPQVGSVNLGDEVEVGANTTIDRATAGTTRVGKGTKLDNLIQIGHNCVIGEHAVIAGMCGISGSTKLGDRVVMGGGVGTKDHITIGDDVVLGGRSGVDRDIKEPGEYFGTPARPVGEALRSFMLIPKLPDLASRLRKLEKQMKELQSEDPS